MTSASESFGPDLSKKPENLSYLTWACLRGWRGPDSDKDPSIFDEKTLAMAIRCFAKDSRAAGAGGDARSLGAWLFEIANALDHPDAAQKLRLMRPRAGRQKTIGDFEMADKRDIKIAATVWKSLNEVAKLEAAVALAMETLKVGRATVFRSLQRKAEYARFAKSLSPKAKMALGFSPDDDDSYQQFVIWLDSFQPACGEETF